MVMELVLETDKEKLLGLKFAFVLLLDPETDLLNLTLTVCLTVLLAVVAGCMSFGTIETSLITGGESLLISSDVSSLSQRATSSISPSNHLG